MKHKTNELDQIAEAVASSIDFKLEVKLPFSIKGIKKLWKKLKDALS